jgi:predicted nucleic acid-binding protein
VGVVVFDSDVLIGFLNGDDAHHARAVERVRESMAPGERRLLCAVNYAEIMIGPLKTGRADVVDRMRRHFSIEVVAVDDRLARRAAEVRARTSLKLPDAFAVATALQADGVVASFDERVVKAYGKLQATR